MEQKTFLIVVHWPGNDRNMTSLRNFKLRFSERLLVVVRGFFSVWCDLRGLVIKDNYLVENSPS